MKRKPTTDPRNIIVTPEMIEAGARTLEQWGNASRYDVAAAVYRAMSMAAPPDRDGFNAVDPTMLDALRLLGLMPRK